MVVSLRELHADDLPILYEYHREPEANRMALFSPREREAFMEHFKKNVLGKASTRKQAIIADAGIAGHVVSWMQDGRRLVGYWVGVAYWGRGVATGALRSFIRDCETERPLFALVAVSNVGSIRVLEKCGFQRLGEPSAGPDGVFEVVMRLSQEGA